METSMPMTTVVEICVKPEPMDCENAENAQNGCSQQTEEPPVKEEEIWIKPEPFEDESQDSIKEEDQGTLSENEARLDEEALNDECNRNRQSNAPSRKQILVFLDFLNEHRDLANCMLRGPSGRVKAHQLWEDIANTLNSISGCTKTTQQWQRVWSDKKYLARKAVAARVAATAAGGPAAPELTLQDEKILGIIGEPIPTRRVGKKPVTPEPKAQAAKQTQDIYLLLPPAVLTELVVPPPEVPKQPIKKLDISRKPYTPRKTDASRKSDVTRKSDVIRKSDDLQQTDVPLPVVAPQVDVPRPPDDPPKLAIQKKDDPPKVSAQKKDDLQKSVQKQDEMPSSPSISDPPSPHQQSQPELNRQGRLRLRACLDPYTKKFINLEEERLKNDARRNTELSEIRSSLQQGTAELAGIRQVMQEMLGVMKQLSERDDKN